MKDNKLSILIADDEKLARRDLKFLLKSIEGVSVVGEAKNGVEALDRIKKLSPQLTLLDIEMPGLNGLQVVGKLLKQGIDTAVVFITAYDHYAVRAFEVNAVDYLLKPVAVERLKDTINRVRQRLAAGEEKSRNLEAVLAAINKREVTKLSIRLEESHGIIDEDDLLYAFVEKGVVTAVTMDSRGVLSCGSLDELQALLSPERFMRVHRGYVVNVDMIREVIPWFSGTFRLKLKNNSMIPLSRGHVKDLRAILHF